MEGHLQSIWIHIDEIVKYMQNIDPHPAILRDFP